MNRELTPKIKKITEDVLGIYRGLTDSLSKEEKLASVDDVILKLQMFESKLLEEEEES